MIISNEYIAFKKTLSTLTYKKSMPIHKLKGDNFISRKDGSATTTLYFFWVYELDISVK